MKVSEVVEALEKNGYTQIKGSYIEWESAIHDKAHVKGACALGQIALNLGIYWTTVEDVLDEIYFDRDNKNLSSYIVDLNDVVGLTCKEIADEIRSNYPEMLNHEVNLTPGNAYDVEKISGYPV